MPLIHDCMHSTQWNPVNPVTDCPQKSGRINGMAVLN